MKIIMVDSLIGNDYSTCLCEKLYEQGADVHLIVPENRKFKGTEKFIINYLSPSKIRNKNKFKKIFEFITYFLSLYKYIKLNEPEVVHYQFFRRKSGALLFKLLRLKNFNLVHTAHNVLPHENNKIDYLLKSIIYNNSNKIIVHSNFIKDKLINSFSVESDKIRVVPHGNFDMYLPSKALSIDEIRKSFCLSKEDNVILFFGFIRDYKGLDTLLDAFEIAALKDPKLKLIIAGSIQKRLSQFYNDKIESSKYFDRIIFHSNYIPKEEVAKYFSVADLVALPYKQIDHSGIIHLAYSFGKAVIATNVGDFSEIIQNKKSGIILSGNSISEFSQGISEAFANKQALIEMGNYARQLSNTKYSWSDVARETLKVYNETI